jgi:hypothetical protein
MSIALIGPRRHGPRPQVALALALALAAVASAVVAQTYTVNVNPSLNGLDIQIEPISNATMLVVKLTNKADQKVRCKLKYDASPQPLERKTVYIDPGKTEQSVLQAKRNWFSVDVDVECQLATKQP